MWNFFLHLRMTRVVGRKEEEKYFRNILEEEYFIFTWGWCGWWEAKKRRNGEDAEVEVRMKFTFHKTQSDFVSFLFQLNYSCFFCDKSSKFSGWFYLLHIFYPTASFVYISVRLGRWTGCFTTSSFLDNFFGFQFKQQTFSTKSIHSHFWQQHYSNVQPYPNISNPTKNLV